MTTCGVIRGKDGQERAKSFLLKDEQAQGVYPRKASGIGCLEMRISSDQALYSEMAG